MSYRRVEQPARACDFCGETYTPHDARQRYCTPRCRDDRAAQVRRERAETYVCPSCGTEGQRQQASATGLCNACARPRGEQNPAWNGGEHFNRALGRWTVFRDGRNVFRYRAVMEEHLGRPLDPNEHVHHLNGDPTDDRIENLQVLDIAEHARLHHRLRKEQVA
jgi:predicted RNA-binding Zn-ribbon protein involved in translation (DUF1610 family)